MESLGQKKEYLLEKGYQEVDDTKNIEVEGDEYVDVELWIKCDFWYPFEVMDQVYKGKSLEELKSNAINFYKSQDYDEVTIRKVFVKYGSKTED